MTSLSGGRATMPRRPRRDVPRAQVVDALLPPGIVTLAGEVVEANRAAGLRVALAESCTGGLVAAALTEIPGSSAVLDRGFVTISGSPQQRRPAVLVPGIDVDLGLEEQLDHGFVTISGGPQQRRPAILATRVDIGSGLEEQLDNPFLPCRSG